MSTAANIGRRNSYDACYKAMHPIFSWAKGTVLMIASQFFVHYKHDQLLPR